MKKILTASILTLMFIANTNAQEQKINVYQDVYIQGGKTTNETLGTTQAKKLLIFNSQADTKYARITYLKFKTPKKLSTLKKVVLNIPIKVYPNENNPELTFNLVVRGVENDKWNEVKLTWKKALVLGVKVAEVEVEQSLTGRQKWIKIPLNAKEVSKLIDGKKDKYITLALLNENFNKISSIVPSKDGNVKNSSYLTIE